MPPLPPPAAPQSSPSSPPLVALQAAVLTFGGYPLFAGVNIAVARGDRLCLVGRNGSGKSTLLQALAGLITLDDGSRFVQPGTRVGYLPQEPDLSGSPTVLDYVAAGLPADASEALHRAEALLDRFGLPPDRVCATLSGGEARRAALARLLAGEPEVLLLDEPTNHLDLPTIEALEEALLAHRGGFLLVSHDRAFLSRLAQRTLWLDRGMIRESGRPFSSFEAWQNEVFAAEEEAAHKLNRKLAVEMKWLREGISARRTRNMGRVRALYALRQQRAERVRGDRQATLVVGEAEKSGRLVIEAEAISKSFPASGTEGAPRCVIRNFSTRILRGDRVGVIGANGAGKTTLLTLLTGRLAPDSGTVRLGTNLDIVWFDQRRASLDPEASIRQTLCPFGGDTVTVAGVNRHVAGYMKDFLFDSRQLDTPTKALSGGERNRLLLATLFARPSNLMVLDEPTNDLDMDTLDLLEEVLADYPGTLLMVSHDRDFLDRLVTSTIFVEGDGRVQEYAGGWSDAQRQRIAPSAITAAATMAGRALPRNGGSGAPGTGGGTAAAKSAGGKRRLSYRDQRELDGLPERIEALTAAIRAAEETLAELGATVGTSATALHAASDALAEKLAERDAAEERWLELESLRETLERGESV